MFYFAILDTKFYYAAQAGHELKILSSPPERIIGVPMTPGYNSVLVRHPIVLYFIKINSLEIQNFY